MAPPPQLLTRRVAGEDEGLPHGVIAAALSKYVRNVGKSLDRGAEEGRIGARAGNRSFSFRRSDCRLHVTHLTEFEKLRNQLSSQAFYIAMNFERPLGARTEDAMKRNISWSDLPPTQAGLSAALRRAFVMPAEERGCEFEELLRKLA
jgi:hypothetical protein